MSKHNLPVPRKSGGLYEHFYYRTKSGNKIMRKAYKRFYDSKKGAEYELKKANKLKLENLKTQKYADKKHPKWTDDEDKKLIKLYYDGVSLIDMSPIMKRSRHACKCRLRTLSNANKFTPNRACLVKFSL